MTALHDIRPKPPEPLFTARECWLLNVVFWTLLVPTMWLGVRVAAEWVGISLTHDPVAVLVSTASCAYVLGRLHERGWTA